MISRGNTHLDFWFDAILGQSCSLNIVFSLSASVYKEGFTHSKLVLIKVLSFLTSLVKCIFKIGQNKPKYL